MSLESAIIEGAGDFLKDVFNPGHIDNPLHEILQVGEEIFDFPDITSPEFKMMMKVLLQAAAAGLITISIVALAGGGVRVTVQDRARS